MAESIGKKLLERKGRLALSRTVEKDLEVAITQQKKKKLCEIYSNCSEFESNRG